ncbi:MAG: protein kinase [Planctomycetota bacterium]
MHGGATTIKTDTNATLRYTLATLSAGVRWVLGAEVQETPREELIQALAGVFSADELKGALEEAFERTMQSLVVGLKQAWLLMETQGEDYCSAFGEKVRTPFMADEGIQGPEFLDFLDAFFLDYDTAVDAGARILGVPELDDATLFDYLLAPPSGSPDDEAAQATQAIRQGLIEVAGLEDEHPIVRMAAWRELFADSLHFHFTDLVERHPAWSRYLDRFHPEALDREEIAALRDPEVKQRLAFVRGLKAHHARYVEGFGEILPNREWLYELADRLEEVDETVSSELLQGRTTKAISAQDLPKIVAAGVGRVHAKLGTSPAARLADSLVRYPKGFQDVVRRARRDFRRCHWNGGEYGEAALMLAGALFALAGPRAAERYYREAAAFGADKATTEYGLFMVELLTGRNQQALGHLIEAATLSPERFALFDLERYVPQELLGAGGAGLAVRATSDEGDDVVVKALWDRVSVVNPKSALEPLQELAKLQEGGLGGFANLFHLGVHLRDHAYVVSEYVYGDDLESFREARGGVVPPSMVAMIGQQVAEALASMHGAKLLHHNLKPGNVRLGAGEEGLTVTLLDPALPNVLLAEPGRVQGVRRLQARSRAGRLIAESFANYTAPEVIRGGLAAAGPASDLYSLGTVLYRLATGAPARSPKPGALPESLRAVVMRCLEGDAAARPTAAQAAELLARATEVPDPKEPSPLRQSGVAVALGVDENDPFAAPRASAPTQAPPAPQPQADPFAAQPGQPEPGVADPFAAQGQADPFAPQGQADPFAPQAQADPFAAQGQADPFAPQGQADPFAAQGQADPFAAQGQADPFAAQGQADPFAAQGQADPFAPQGQADPFAQSGDPFAPQGQADPFAPQGGGDPFAQSGDPRSAGWGDPFAQSGDPFAPQGGGDPSAQSGDPFAPQGGGDPFAQGGDPFAPQGGGDPFAQSGDPFAPQGGGDPFAQSGDPFAPQGQADLPAPADPSPRRRGPVRALDPFALDGAPMGVVSALRGRRTRSRRRAGATRSAARARRTRSRRRAGATRSAARARRTRSRRRAGATPSRRAEIPLRRAEIPSRPRAGGTPSAPVKPTRSRRPTPSRRTRRTPSPSPGWAIPSRAKARATPSPRAGRAPSASGPRSPARRAIPSPRAARATPSPALARSPRRRPPRTTRRPSTRARRWRCSSPCCSRRSSRRLPQPSRGFLGGGQAGAWRGPLPRTTLRGHDPFAQNDFFGGGGDPFAQAAANDPFRAGQRPLRAGGGQRPLRAGGGQRPVRARAGERPLRRRRPLRPLDQRPLRLVHDLRLDLARRAVALRGVGPGVGARRRRRRRRAGVRAHGQRPRPQVEAGRRGAVLHADPRRLPGRGRGEVPQAGRGPVPEEGDQGARRGHRRQAPGGRAHLPRHR